MRYLIPLLLAPVFLVACATTDTDKRSTSSTGFEKLNDGRVYHPGTKLVCPSSLLGSPIDSHKEFGNLGRDAACGYAVENGALTIFLSDLDYSFKEIFGDSARSVLLGPLGEDLEVNEKATQACVLGGLLTAAVTGDSGKSADAGVYKFDTVMFSGNGKKFLLSMTEIDGKFFKLRHTDFGKADSFQTVSYVNDKSDSDLDFCLNGAAALRTVYTATLNGR